VAAVADPETGYAVLVDGLWNVVGGTSAVAPLFAGLIARINSQLGRPTGLINAGLYAAGSNSGFKDIVSGNNSYGGVQGYLATPGWDAVTGWGSPNGNGLLRLFSPPPQAS
jgi:kumamolisin